MTIFKEKTCFTNTSKTIPYNLVVSSSFFQIHEISHLLTFSPTRCKTARASSITVKKRIYSKFWMRHYSKSHFCTLIISFVTILSKTPPKQNTFCSRGILTHGTYHEGIYFNPPDYQSNRDIVLRILFKPSWLRQNRVLKLKIGSFIKGLRKNSVAVVPPGDLASVRIKIFPTFVSW